MGAGAHDDRDARLADSLRAGLGHGFEVRWPRMPQEDDPGHTRWGDASGHELAAVDDAAVPVGHSVGGRSSSDDIALPLSSSHNRILGEYA